MAQKPPDDEISISFPLNGTDTSTGYGEQRPNTTRFARNVRSLDPLLERQRGGSRHGLIRYPDDQLPGSGSVVTVVTLTGTGIWTAPAALIGTVQIEAWGAGADGQAGVTLGGNGNGGGGGEYAKKTAFAAVPSTGYAYFCGVEGSEQDTTFNVTTTIAKPGLNDGTGGTGGAGDVLHAGGNGGVTGVGLGGGGGGGAGGPSFPGDDGLDGDPSNTGGQGGLGGDIGVGDGGKGGTGDPGNESLAVAGADPGGGGGGGSNGTDGEDPSFQAGAIGGDGRIKLTYNLPGTPVQHLNQLITLDTNYLLTTFENYTPDFIPDPSTNNKSQRNPGREIPPGGSAVQPVRTRPAVLRRRIQAVAVPTTQSNGTNAIVTSTLTDLPGATPIGAATVTLSTRPSGMDGDGLSGVTIGAGTAAFTVNEPSYEGTIIYTATHEYTDATTGRRVTVTGTTAINWTPNYTLAFEPPFASHVNLLTDGLTVDEIQDFLDAHPYVARLTRTADGAGVAGRTIKLRDLVDYYSAFGCGFDASATGAYNGVTKMTDENGYAYFPYVSFLFQKLVTQYTVTMIPRRTAGGTPLASSPAVTNWFTEGCP